MLLNQPLWWVLPLLASTYAYTPTPTPAPTPKPTPVPRAQIPTKPGEIGITPIDDDLGGPENYRGVIEVADPSLLSMVDHTTTWLHKHVDYLTETTVQGSTSTVQLSIATVTAAAEGVAAGDITITLAEGLARKLADTAAEAVKACSAAPKIKRGRNSVIVPRAAYAVLSCLCDFGNQAVDNGLFELVNPAEWEALPNFQLAQDAGATLAGVFQIAKNKSRQYMLALILSAAEIFTAQAVVDAGVAGTAIVVGTYVLTPADFPKKPKKEEKCPEKYVMKSIISPHCFDSECKGDLLLNICTTGKYKKCACLVDLDPIIDLEFDNFFQTQANYIQAVAQLPNDPPPKKFADPVTVLDSKNVCPPGGIYSPDLTFDMMIPADKNAIEVHLPIADGVGKWALAFDKTSYFQYYTLSSGEAGATTILSGSQSLPDNKISWEQTQSTTNTTMLIKFYDVPRPDFTLHGTFTGTQKCEVIVLPKGQPCINGFDKIKSQIEQNLPDKIDLTNSDDLGKLPNDRASGEGNPRDNDYWVLGTDENVYLVVGHTAQRRGYPDLPGPLSKTDMIAFINDKYYYACYTAETLLVGSPPAYLGVTGGYAQYCLASKDTYKNCSGTLEPPS